MAVDGNGEVSACGRENIGIDLGFRDDVTGASVSISVCVSEEEEVDILSEGEDIMVGVSGADIFFDGIYVTEGQEEEDVGVVRDDEDEFNDYEIHIDESLEIKETVHSFSLPGQISPQEVVQSFPFPGQISPQELIPVVNPPSDQSFKESKCGGINQRSSVPKGKRESIDVKPKECGSSGHKHIDVVSYSMPSRFQEFEDFLNGSTKCSTAEDKTVQQLQMPAQAGEQDRNQYLEKPLSKESKTDLPGCDSLVSSVKDIKDSYWTDMVIQTESPIKLLPSVDTVRGSKAYSVSTSFRADVQNKRLRMKTLNYNHAPMAATTVKYSPAELLLTFDLTQAIPSESKLNNIFRRFGSLIETETLIYHESCCARVVFKKSPDAEVAVSSAKAFNIMGPSVVNYELGYTPLSAASVMKVAESEAINTHEYEPEEINAQEYETEVMNDREYEPEVMNAREVEPEVMNNREIEPEVMNAREVKPEGINAQEYEHEDMTVEQIEFEHLGETSAAGVTLENEDYEGLDDVDIME